LVSPLPISHRPTRHGELKEGVMSRVHVPVLLVRENYSIPTAHAAGHLSHAREKARPPHQSTMVHYAPEPAVPVGERWHWQSIGALGMVLAQHEREPEPALACSKFREQAASETQNY